MSTGCLCNSIAIKSSRDTICARSRENTAWPSGPTNNLPRGQRTIKIRRAEPRPTRHHKRAAHRCKTPQDTKRRSHYGRRIQDRVHRANHNRREFRRAAIRANQKTRRANQPSNSPIPTSKGAFFQSNAGERAAEAEDEQHTRTYAKERGRYEKYAPLCT